MYAYLVLASENEIARMNRLDEVLSYIERIEPMVGGFSLEAFAALPAVFPDAGAEPLYLTEHRLSDRSPFYAFDRKFCLALARAQEQDLLNGAVLWSDSTAWNNTEVNEMDLAGTILDVAELCKRAEADQNLFVLVSHEA